MPLESATYISQLVDTNPVHADGINQTDGHLRLIKIVLQTQFPNLGAAAVTPTAAALSNVGTDGTASAPGVAYTADNTAGFYRNATGQQTIVGQLLGNGALPVGSLATFAFVPTTMASGGGSNPGKQYLECDGSTYLIAQYPALASALGTNYGGDGVTTFGVPKLTDTGRFIRSRTSGVAVGTSQSNQNAAHTHGVTDPQHTHTATVTDPQHTHGITQTPHTHSINATNGFDSSGGGGSGNSPAFGSGNTGGANANITINAASTGITVANASATTGITINSAGGTEARPEAFIAVIAIKT